MEKISNKKSWGEWFFDLTAGKDHKATKAGGSGLVAASLAYGIISGDLVGAGVGAVGGLGLRFRDKIQRFLDFVDREEDIKAKLEEALKKSAAVSPGLRPFIAADPEVVKKAMDEAANKLNSGKELSAADQVVLAIGDSLCA